VGHQSKDAIFGAVPCKYAIIIRSKFIALKKNRVSKLIFARKNLSLPPKPGRIWEGSWKDVWKDCTLGRGKLS
jgi:hypothetical protein